MSNTFHSLKVAEVTTQTDDAVTVSFEIPEELKETFSYKQGQYLTLKFDINGEEVRRSYSMSSCPLEDQLAVTVKRVPQGKASNFIYDQIRPGSQVEVMPPEGRFYTELDADQRKTYYLFGAGSGITPLMSHIKTILEEEPQSEVKLLYGNRNEDSIIFKEELEQLQQRYQGQLQVEHILSQPHRVKAKGIAGMFSKGKIEWPGRVGRIDGKQVLRFLQEQPQRDGEAEYFICGPGTMIDNVKAALLEQGVNKKKVHTESFGTSESPKKEAAKTATTASDNSQVTVHLDGQEFTVEVPEEKSILDVLLEQKYDPPYSCTSGACSSCMAKVINGSVRMDACYALDDEEVAEGYILTCQSHPTTPTLEITYEV